MPQMTLWRMRTARWIPKAPNTQAVYVILITLPLQQWLHERASVLRCRGCAESDGTCAETTFRLSPKRTSPFKSAGESVQSTAGSRGVRISGINAGYTTCRGRVRVLATPSIRQFPLRFPSRASHSERSIVNCLSCWNIST
jgi:hypothetical protein